MVLVGLFASAHTQAKIIEADPGTAGRYGATLHPAQSTWPAMQAIQPMI